MLGWFLFSLFSCFALLVRGRGIYISFSLDLKEIVNYDHSSRTLLVGLIEAKFYRRLRNLRGFVRGEEVWGGLTVRNLLSMIL